MKYFHILIAFITCILLFFSNKLWAQCPNPVAAYAILGNVTVICEGESIVVDNLVDENNPVSCVDIMIWDWGDGTKDTVTHFNNMTHVYNFPPFNGSCIHGNGEEFDIDLRVYYHNGDTHHQLAPVTVRPKPQAAFMIPSPICISDPSVTFNNKSCYADSYKWTINPGNVVLTTEDPQYTFPGIGTYTVQLEATSPANWGCGTDIAVQQVQVVAAPQAVATANISDFCAPSILQLSSTGSTNFTSFTWTIMTSGGAMYQWLDTVMNPQNLPNPKVLLKTPGTYTITLTVHGAPECDDAVFTLSPIVINESPIASLSTPSPFCYEGNPIAYTPVGSVISNGGYPNLSYSWFFENGTPSTSSALNPGQVTWNQPGDWKITFIVIGDPSPSNICGSDTVEKIIHIATPSTIGVTHTNPPPGDCGPYVIAFNNTSTGTTTWEWLIKKNGGAAVFGVDYQFENGTTKDSQNVTIRFLTPGEYTVQLQLENVACGPTQSQTFPFSVKMAPTVDAMPVGLQCVPAQVTFPAAVFSDGNDPSTTLNWTFPGGAPGTATGPGPHVVDFTQPGMPLVMVTAQNGCGTAVDTFSFILDIKTQVTFQPAPDSICQNAPAIQLSTNLAAPCFPPNIPNGMLNPAALNDGWNAIVVTNCSSAPGCGTSDTLNIFVLNEILSFGAVPNFCDTIGTATITGFTPSLNVEFGGGPYITAGGLIDAVVAGYGEHPITMTYEAPGLGCVFTQNTTFNVFEVPTSGMTGPVAGCTNFSQAFNFSGIATGLGFEWTFENGIPGTSTQQNPTVEWPIAGDFNVQLIVINPSGCSDTAYSQIHIEAPLDVAITALPTPTEVCPDDPVTVTVTVTGQNPQNWTLYVGNYDTLPNFTTGTLQFLSGVADTTYILTASASNACPSEVASLDVLVHPLPGPDLGVSSLSICSGDTAFFYQNSTGGPFTAQIFEPGNGDPASADLPTDGVRYFALNNQITEYFAILTLSNDCGTRSDTVKISVLPEDIIPAVQMNDTIFCVGDTLWLTSFATSVSHPNLAVSYHFSNGLTLTGKDAAVALTEPGLFWFDQWVTDGCSWDKVRRFFSVRPAPAVDFSQIQDTVCVGGTLAGYTYPVDWEHSFRSFTWQCSDGTTASGASFEKTWPLSGWQSVTLTVTFDTSGCSTSLSKNFHIRANPLPVVAAQDTTACGDLTTTLFNANPAPDLGYEWSFSDNTTAVGSPVSHTFVGPGVFAATLRATDIWGCTADTTLDGLHAIAVPHPVFTVSEPHACGLGHTVFLDNLTTDGPGSSWYLNGNFIGTHTDTSLTFNVAGDYLLKLVSTNQWGCEASSDYLFKVLPPLLALGAGPTQVCEWEAVVFDNFSQNPDSVQWYFGNGASSTAFSPVYTYPDAGNYPVTLIAMQAGYCADTFFFPQNIIVLESPVAGFSATSSSMGIVTIVDSSQNATAWLYEFPDLDLTMYEQNPVVDYSANGLKTIIQTVTNALGCLDHDTLFFEPLFFGGLAVPNAIIPDVGTGPHNCFTPTGEGLESFVLDIFAPWGANVFHAEGVVNGRPTPAAIWCGKDVKGELLPAGAYLWQIEATFRRPDGSLQKWDGMTIGRGSTVRRTIGSVTLLR
ncbi:MAG: PKD domain-containing protein [Saprospiraceae bacterium]|nr:PKD domain-containing protein [Saprospiraceae bacterium]